MGKKMAEQLSAILNELVEEILLVFVVVLYFFCCLNYLLLFIDMLIGWYCYIQMCLSF